MYSGDDEDDFLYCLPDKKEIHVCGEMVDNVGYPKLEVGLSAIVTPGFGRQTECELCTCQDQNSRTQRLHK
jgi:hypothetical protein